MRSKPNKTKKKEKIRINTFVRVIGTKLPPALEKTCQPLFYIGVTFLLASLVELLIPSLRQMAPFASILGLVIVVFAYLKKRHIICNGYDEYIFKTLDYTYLTRALKTPTGILLIDPERHGADRELYHVAVSGKDNVPPLDWLIRVYVPKNAVISEYNGRKHFSVVYGYQVEDAG